MTCSLSAAHQSLSTLHSNRTHSDAAGQGMPLIPAQRLWPRPDPCLSSTKGSSPSWSFPSDVCLYLFVASPNNNCPGFQAWTVGQAAGLAFQGDTVLARARLHWGSSWGIKHKTCLCPPAPPRNLLPGDRHHIKSTSSSLIKQKRRGTDDMG